MDARTDLTVKSKFKVKSHQQWYATHRLGVVYLHAKYEKPILNDKKVTARTRFVIDAGTDLTLKSKFKVKGHQQWYATHRLEVVYLHANYAKPVLNDKNSPDTICYGRTDEWKDAHTDHYRALMNVHKDEPSRQWSKYANMGRLNLTCNNECL